MPRYQNTSNLEQHYITGGTSGDPSRVDNDAFEKQMRLDNAACEAEVRASPSEGYVKQQVHQLQQWTVARAFSYEPNVH